MQQMHPLDNWWEQGFPFLHRFPDAKNKTHSIFPSLSVFVPRLNSLDQTLLIMAGEIQLNSRDSFPFKSQVIVASGVLQTCKKSEANFDKRYFKEGINFVPQGELIRRPCNRCLPSTTGGNKVFPLLHRFPDAKNKTHSISLSLSED
ncbi:hypothetical protein CDAR_221841 [Caerostris darwini]|uniref:Uncharacterized protein n=1 Tax=Caerostris darwini TaxID=1538125 RepID=A0AAV4N1A7_9ARAC|nr:hypothetical protein CDAR_221841 [Caerostris darwini]